MPLYEYQCPGCGRFEVIQRYSDDPLAACPTCGAGVQKLLSAPAIQFKGTGWYITDYARKGASPEGKNGDQAKAAASPAEAKASSEGASSTASPTSAGSTSS